MPSTQRPSCCSHVLCTCISAAAMFKRVFAAVRCIRPLARIVVRRCGCTCAKLNCVIMSGVWLRQPHLISATCCPWCIDQSLTCSWCTLLPQGFTSKFETLAGRSAMLGAQHVWLQACTDMAGCMRHMTGRCQHHSTAWCRATQGIACQAWPSTASWSCIMRSCTP